MLGLVGIVLPCIGVDASWLRPLFSRQRLLKLDFLTRQRISRKLPGLWCSEVLTNDFLATTS